LSGRQTLPVGSHHSPPAQSAELTAGVAIVTAPIEANAIIATATRWRMNVLTTVFICGPPWWGVCTIESGPAAEVKVHAVAVQEVIRDGHNWRIGTASDVGWIATGTTVGLTITSGIPPVFDDYATVVLPEDDAEQLRYDRAVVAILKSLSPQQRWWLGYLERGPYSDVVFPEAAPVTLYAGWPYVLVQAGPEEAASWRRIDNTPFRSPLLPDLMFPADRSWLISTLWDDDWTCVGGPVALVDALLNHPDLRARVRRVGLDEDATPPGHRAI
jgi:hypothetical protein